MGIDWGRFKSKDTDSWLDKIARDDASQPSQAHGVQPKTTSERPVPLRLSQPKYPKQESLMDPEPEPFIEPVEVEKVEPKPAPVVVPPVVHRQPAAAPKPVSKAQRPAAPVDGAEVPHTTVSINIHIPKIDKARLRQLYETQATRVTELAKHLWKVGREKVLETVQEHRRESIIGGSVAGVLIVGLIALPFLLGGSHGDTKKQAGADNKGTSAGSKVVHEKPTFDVVTPTNKPQLAETDGTDRTGRYDGTRDSFSFRDSMQGFGFIVSQQPVPSNFANGREAVDKIGPTFKPTPKKIETSYGAAYISTNEKTSAQMVVGTVKGVMVFIQSAHEFKESDWTIYLNSLE